MKFQIGAIAGSLVVALVMLASVAYSQTSGNSQEKDRSQRRAMQRAMMEACANQSAGTSCSFSREGRTVSGVCQATPRGKLICRGGRGERGRGMRDSNGEGMSEDYRPEQLGNSQEKDRSQRRAMQRAMMEACANQSAGTSCSFSREGRTVSGVCQATTRGKLICRGGRGERGRGTRDSNGEGMSEDYGPEQ